MQDSFQNVLDAAPLARAAAAGDRAAESAIPGVRLPSLPESFRTVDVPAGAGFLRRMFAFAGPGYLIAVGYMDPGNWATDVAGGSRFGYTLLSVVLLSSLMAMFLQALCVKLGVATGRDLAQACREHYSRRTAIALWLGGEIAIAACDLAEVLGSAVA
ncbi:MAG TPA: Nramp family divalent metal transporter, partial [Candidatus Acidoferrales bacterium]|nr:Nramp family divalent metal transporter [Candidatus Acidoferrales bacterium]